MQSGKMRKQGLSGKRHTGHASGHGAVRVATELDRLPAKRPSRDRRADPAREPLHEHVTASGDAGAHRDPVVTGHAQQW